MKKYLIYVLSVVLLSGCLDIPLEDQFSDPDAITTTETARELLSSAYNSLPRHQMELSVLSDDFVPSNLAAKYVELLNLYNWQEKAIDDLSDNIWNGYYVTVAIVNALLPRLDNVLPKDEADKAELENICSEAKALKAMCYFDLLRLYGPRYSAENLTKEGIIIKNRLELDFLPRSSVKDCVDEIDRLLSEAVIVDNDDAEVFCLSTSAIKALQVELELYKGGYDKVVEIGLPLLNGAESRWTKASYEALWSANDSDDRLFAPYIFDYFYRDLCYDKTSGDYFVLNPMLSYEDTDLRRSWAVYNISMGGSDVASLGKYNRMYYDNITVRYINTLRYSGVCFAVAEAYARDGQYDEARALLNTFLRAYGATELKESLEGDELVEEILFQKQKEFAGEGIRIFDLKRHGSTLKRMTNFGSGVSSTISADDYRWLFPIPQSEYKYNDKISQNNPGWPFIKTE